MNRAQKILRYVASRKQPVDFPSIVRAVQPGASTATRSLFSAQLHQLAKAGKLKRTGKPMAYSYSATPRTLVDGRTVDANGKPRDKKARQAQPKAPKPKPIARVVKQKPAAKPRPKPTAAQNFVINTPGKRVLGKDVKAEQSARIAADVATFLKRGGRIQKLAMGASSNPQSDLQRRNSERAAGRARAKQRIAEDLDDAIELDAYQGDEAIAA